jgi:methylated-DNA-[protein]-cysteine S-methyltransferase
MKCCHFASQKGGSIMVCIRTRYYQIENDWLGVAATSQGLVGMILPVPTLQAAVRELARVMPSGHPSCETLTGGPFSEVDLDRLGHDLNAYYSGVPVALDYPVDWETCGYTTFQAKALKACKDVPYGYGATYGDLAKAVGNPRSSRAVGGAMHINRVSLVVP